MELERDAKRKVFQEILELAKGQLGESLKTRSPKLKAAAVKVPEPKSEKPACDDCESGDGCEVHDGDFKDKLASLYEKLTGE